MAPSPMSDLTRKPAITVPMRTPAPISRHDDSGVARLQELARRVPPSQARSDRRSARPVILFRGLPARPGFLRRLEADSGAGSARDEKKPAVDMSTTYTICRTFTGATGLEPATSGVTDRPSRLPSRRR